ncbi:MAG: hypothetical protein MJ192_05555 [Clostridia bacterium]|nr:hypothetical protein [Clostridia bacterium]
MNGRKIYELLNGVDDAFIEDADVTDRLAAGADRREREPSAFSRFMNSPAAAAILSGVVAFAVLFFIVRAGHNAPVGPDPTPAGHGTESVTDLIVTEPVTEPATLPERETEVPGTTADTEKATGTLPAQHPGIGIIGGADGPTLALILRTVLPLVLAAAVVGVGVFFLIRAIRRRAVLPRASRPAYPLTKPQSILLTVLAALCVVFAPYLLTIQIETIRFETMGLIATDHGYEMVTIPGRFREMLPQLLPLFLVPLLTCVAGPVLAVVNAVRARRRRQTDRCTVLLTSLTAGCAAVAAFRFRMLGGLSLYDDLMTGGSTDLAELMYWRYYRLFGFIGPNEFRNDYFLTRYTVYPHIKYIFLGLILAAAGAALILILRGRPKTTPTEESCRRSVRVLTVLTSVLAALSLLGCISVIPALFTVSDISLTDTAFIGYAALLMLGLPAACFVLAVILSVRLKKGKLSDRTGVVLSAVTAGLLLFLALWMFALTGNNFEGWQLTNLFPMETWVLLLLSGVVKNNAWQAVLMNPVLSLRPCLALAAGAAALVAMVKFIRRRGPRPPEDVKPKREKAPVDPQKRKKHIIGWCLAAAAVIVTVLLVVGIAALINMIGSRSGGPGKEASALSVTDRVLVCDEPLPEGIMPAGKVQTFGKQTGLFVRKREQWVLFAPSGAQVCTWQEKEQVRRSYTAEDVRLALGWDDETFRSKLGERTVSENHVYEYPDAVLIRMMRADSDDPVYNGNEVLVEISRADRRAYLTACTYTAKSQSTYFGRVGARLYFEMGCYDFSSHEYLLYTEHEDALPPYGAGILDKVRLGSGQWGSLIPVRDAVRADERLAFLFEDNGRGLCFGSAVCSYRQVGDRLYACLYAEQDLNQTEDDDPDGALLAVMLDASDGRVLYAQLFEAENYIPDISDIRIYCRGADGVLCDPAMP